MTKKTRKFLLIMMIVLFAVLAPVVILYSIGYRLNSETWELVETGALSFRTQPSGAVLTIDGKERGVTPKTLRSIVPRDYHISIEKEGHHRWEKTLSVEPQLVTEARDIILPPMQLSLDVVVDTEFDEIFFSPSGRWLIGKTDEILFRHRVSDGSFIASVSLSSPDALEEMRWSPNEERVIIPTRTSTTLVTFDTPRPTTAVLIPNLFWGPKENDVLFRLVRSQTGEQFLQRIGLDTFAVEPFPTPVSGVAVASDVFLVRVEDPTPHLELWDATGRGLDIIILLEGPRRDPNLQPAPESTQDILVLRNNETGSTWVYDGREEQWHDIGANVAVVAPSMDEKKVAVVTTDGLLSIYWLAREEIQPHRDPGDVEIITRAMNLSSVQWMTGGSPYVLTTQGNRVWLTELDGRDNRNRWALLTLRSPAIYTFSNDKNIYIISGGVAYSARIDQ